MHKKIIKSSMVLTLILAAIFLSSSYSSDTSATEQQDVDFEVDVSEALSVSITTPSSWASGSAGTFLRNKVTVDVVANNVQGFTASMIASDANAELKHSSKNTSISTLNTSYACTNNITCPEFPSNKWGYTIDDGINLNVYHPMVGSSGSPISLISTAESTQQNPITSRDIYFGAKSDISQTAGTYSGTVVFYVVSGAVAAEQEQEQEPEPAAPSNSPEVTPAATPSSIASYSAPATTNNTVPTATSTTTTSQGNTLDSYQEPAGVTNSSDIHDNSILTTGLAVAASVAATSGIILFIVAKRKKDDDAEEQQ